MLEEIRVGGTAYATCGSGLYVGTVWKHGKWRRATWGNMAVLRIGHPGPGYRSFRASVPHASVSPCLGFEALIIKQDAQVYS